nr:Maf family protein [Burkholderiaceae bacterium]
VQGLAAVFIERIEGSYSGVMGLPLFETARLLALAGLKVL